MKPAPFDYVRPDSLSETCALLAADEDARIIAGGQTLIPMLAMRLARPAKLIDILRLGELHGISAEREALVIGAVTRQVEVEHSEIVHRSLPLLAKALPWVGHPPTRNRGTVGGSIAHADPAAEMPGIAVACDAEIAVVGAAGSRVIRADDFFVAPLITTLAADEIIIDIRLPAWPATRRWGFREFSRRRGDFAMAAAAAASGALAVAAERVAYRPLRLSNAPKLAPLISAIGPCFISPAA